MAASQFSRHRRVLRASRCSFVLASLAFSKRSPPLSSPYFRPIASGFARAHSHEAVGILKPQRLAGLGQTREQDRTAKIDPAASAGHVNAEQNRYEMGGKIISSSDSSTSPMSDTSEGWIAWDSSAELEAGALVEGCIHPAKMTSVTVKNGMPENGHVAANAIDGDASTRWVAKGRNKWMEVGFDGGEDGHHLVEGIAIAFFRGNRRVAFFDLELFNSAGELVASLEDVESGGLSQEFEEFYFNEPAKGSTMLISVKGTTAGAWNSIIEVETCLLPTPTPAPLPAPTLPPESSLALTHIGCFEDDDTGATRAINGDHSQQDGELTPLTCAAFCTGYKYMGLQFSRECFCGDSYFNAQLGAIPSDDCYMPCDGDANVVCGGPWANSVYIVGDPADPTPEELEAEGANREDDGIPRRQLTITNNCEEQIRVGATGGYVKNIETADESCPDGSVLDDSVGACFWGLPLPEDNQSYDLQPGSSLRLSLDNEAINGVRWSGNLWASTGCESKVGCETASCIRNSGYPDGYCPPSTGPTGPVTKAEFTLIDTGVDYYDVTIIDGINLPVEMRPDPASSPLERDGQYWCSNPGGATSMSDTLDGCTWHFDATSVEGLEQKDMTSYLRWVRNDGAFTDCETDEDCVGVSGQDVGENLKCGTLFGQDTLNCGVTEERFLTPVYKMFPKKCGSSLGWHSANGVCGLAGPKPLGYFPNSYPFMCHVETGQIAGSTSTQADLYGCSGTYYGQSGYSKNADETACGCPVWENEGINAPVESPCYSHNPYWDALSLPWLRYLKRACPTAYCFPFDDHSSTFVCRNEDENNTHNGENSMSYLINFCPAESEAHMHE